MQQRRQPESTPKAQTSGPAAPELAAPEAMSAGPQPTAAAAGAPTDPSSFTGQNGNAIVEAPIDVGETQNPVASTPAGLSGDRDVRVLHDASGPLKTVGDTRPAAAALYDEKPSTGECVNGWSAITGQVGTTDAPILQASLAPDHLFIDGKPTVEDIHQGGIGDCYLMAVLGTLVSTNPAHLTGMMSAAGNTVSVRFNRYDTTASKWAPVTITVTSDAAHTSTAAGDPEALLGASPRIGKAPIAGEWSADVASDNLLVIDEAVYEGSLWVPMMEKAYAAFAERYGQYGGKEAGNATTDGAGNAKSGYEIMSGGLAENLYGVFYGDKMQSNGNEVIQYDPAADVVTTNLDVIKALLKLRGDGIPADESYALTASIGSGEAIERLDRQVAYTAGRPYIKTYGAPFGSMLQNLQQVIAAWRAAPDADKAKALDRVAKTAAHAVKPGNWPVLDGDREGGEFRDLQDLLLIASNVGTDSSSGQRSTYASHEYTVLGSSFRDAGRADLALTLANLATEATKIDATTSEVHLRNPHGTNSPNRMGKSGDGDGDFWLTFEQFCRSFKWGAFGRVKKT